MDTFPRCSLGTTLTLKHYRYAVCTKNIHMGSNELASFLPRSKFHHPDPAEPDTNTVP